MIDWPLALQTSCGDSNLLNDVLRAFQQEGPMLIEQLHQAIKGRDAELLMRSAHTLKGNLRSVGAVAAIPEAREVERLGREGNLEDAQPGVLALERKVGEVLAAIRDHLAQHGVGR